ncbi:MAG: peptidase S9 [Phycisphaerae bacterium]
MLSGVATSVVLALVFFSCAFAQNAPSAAPRPFSVHDLVAFDRISDPVVSPDGSRAVFALRKTDLDANKGRTHLWTVKVDGSDLHQLTNQPESDSQPRWSPDGKSVYFLSSRSGSSQVWRIELSGGEAKQVTDLPLDVNGFVLSPDGTSILLCLDVYVDLPNPADTAARLKEREARKATGRLYDAALFRHWDSWKDGRRGHLFVLPLDASGAAKPTATPIDLMNGMNADSPSKPFGGVEEITFTPDGRSVVFAAKHVGREEAWSTDHDLYVVPVDGSSTPRCLTDDNPAWDTHPVFSPDGKTLAWLAMRVPGYEADRFRILLKSWPDGPVKSLTETWDRSPAGFIWSADGKSIFATADNVGQHSLFSVDVASGAAKAIVPQGHARFPQRAGDRLLIGLDHLQSPVELYTLKPDGSDVKAITKVNAERLAAVQTGEPEQFSFKGWNDETVHVYVVKPVGFDSAKKYPVAFLIHGGPQGSFGNDFHYRWNPQTYAGAGYAAVMVDFHGSTGYGQAFCDSIQNDWGGKPLEDLKKGLEATLQRYPWMDGARVAALGASYGGYMINWIAGNWPDRFRCLVNHDGVFDTRMGYFDTEELWFPEREHGGTPWDRPESFEEHNPVNFVKNWKTPMLVIHGGNDYRVCDTHGIGAFNALQRKGIPSKFLHFPDENHWVLKPHNSILWHETVIGWLDQWCK